MPTWKQKLSVLVLFTPDIGAFVFVVCLFVVGATLGTPSSLASQFLLPMLMFAILTFAALAPRITKDEKILEKTHFLRVSFASILGCVGGMFLLVMNLVWYGYLAGGISFCVFALYYLWQLYRSELKQTLSQKASLTKPDHAHSQ